MRSRRLLLVGLATGLATCRGGARPAASPAAASVADEAKSLIAQGDADGALSRLQAASQTDGEVLFLEGLAWARKAETAPLPTPMAPVSPAPRGGAQPAPPELKAEEEQALAFFERAVSVQPELAAAHQAIADLLAPHALRRAAQERALSAGNSQSGRRKETAPAVPAGGPDLSVERVLQAYRRAAQADRTSKPVVEAWIEFARKVGRLEEADAGFQQLLLRDRENAAPFVRYGDFLAAERKDDLGAIAQYSQALIWQPTLEEARVKIADIYLAQAASHLERREYATALARLGDARKYVGPPGTPQAERLSQLQAQIAQIRGR